MSITSTTKRNYSFMNSVQNDEFYTALIQDSSWASIIRMGREAKLLIVGSHHEL